MGPLGTAVLLGSEGPLAPQDRLGKWVTEAREALRASEAPRVTLADLVPEESLAWPDRVGSRVCQARMAGTACQDLMARRERPLAMVPQERRALMGCQASLDERGPKARRESWAKPGSWVRLAPLESPASLETLAFQGSAARLAIEAQWGPLAHKVLLGPPASEASRAERAAQENLASRVPKASVVKWVTGAQEVLQAQRETRALQVPMVFLGTKESWVPVVLSDPKESLEVEGSWAPKASRDPTAPVVSRASLDPPGPWASRGCKASPGLLGNLEFRGKKPVSSASGSCVET